MKSLIRHVVAGEIEYKGIMFVCPGCAEIGGTGLHLLPINSDNKQPSWEWDGNLIIPTLSPSIRTNVQNNGMCHKYLKAGIIEFLGDCEHSLANKKVELPDLPDWIIKEQE